MFRKGGMQNEHILAGLHHCISNKCEGDELINRNSIELFAIPNPPIRNVGDLNLQCNRDSFNSYTLAYVKGSNAERYWYTWRHQSKANRTNTITTHHGRHQKQRSWQPRCLVTLLMRRTLWPWRRQMRPTRTPQKHPTQPTQTPQKHLTQPTQ